MIADSRKATPKNRRPVSEGFQILFAIEVRSGLGEGRGWVHLIWFWSSPKTVLASARSTVAAAGKTGWMKWSVTPNTTNFSRLRRNFSGGASHVTCDILSVTVVD